MKKIYASDEFELYIDESIDILSNAIIDNTLEKF